MSAGSDMRIARDGARVDPMLPAYSDRCRCSGCDKYFASTAAFDRHRTGDFRSGRRCRSEAEMLVRGMAKAANGYWITKPRPVSVMPAEDVPCRARAEIAPRRHSRCPGRSGRSGVSTPRPDRANAEASTVMWGAVVTDWAR
jgi:hypothetical protein